MDNLTPEQRQRNMQAIKCKGSKIENTLAKALWARGHRYRKNNKKVFGKPDFTFKKFRIAIFVDSEFWHGKNWEGKKFDHKTNIDFWCKKNERNISRDKLVTDVLKKENWTVLRFWGKEIMNNIENCLEKIEGIIKQKMEDVLHKKS